MNFYTNHLRFNDYLVIHNGEHDPCVSQLTDDTLINRSECHEVLLLIREIMQRMELDSEYSFHKIERMIRDITPPAIRQRKEIMMWVMANFYTVP
ncbi:MAG: hypothetical protein V4616_01055 [Bacteroidota bacterium]